MVQVKKLESQDLLIQSFDPLTQQTLEIAPQKYKNTIAEYLFPDSTFTSSSFYKNSTPEQIEKIEGKTLQFANVSKGYFSDTGKEREALFPNKSDAAAYGSIPFTDCRNFHEIAEAKIAIIDDVTGENSLGLEPIAAKRLVGDCYSQIDSSLHSLIKGEVNTPFQFRIGIKEQKTTVARIAKGTLSPKDLSDLGVDLVLAKSSFKGRKGEENQEIKVGIYDWNLGVGLKTHAYRGEQSLGAQILVNYPLAVEALLPLIQHRLNQLKEIATDPTKLAKDYIDSIDRRYRFSAKNSEAFKEMFADEDLTKEELDVLAEVAASSENEERFYHLIKADLEGHRQLLEHPALVKVLNNHLRKQYVELATGRFVKFQAALLQPSEQLKENEFCDPKLPDGTKVLVTRSPFLNSNNLIELTNKHIEEVKDLEGVVFMNPKTAALALQADFDGDRVAFEAVPESIDLKATKEEQLHQKFLMTLADEVKEKQLLENRYADVVKKAKVPYKGSFSEIALSAKENQIGTISRAVMKTIAIENEIDFLPEAEKANYLSKAVKSFKPLATKSDLFSNWLGNAQKDPEYYSKMLEVTTSLDRQVKAIAFFDKDRRSIDEKLQVIKNFHHQLVGVLGNELQVAVDGPKSALRPDGNILNTVDALTKYREILWLDDYKSSNLYLDKPMRTSSFSPIDQMAKLVNENWATQQLQPRKTHQFRPLFGSVSFTSEQQQKMEEVKSEHNRLYSKVHQLRQENEKYSGPRMTLSSRSGKSLEVIGLDKSKHPLTFELEQMHIEVRLDPKSPLKYAVFALVPGQLNELKKPLFQHLGYLSSQSETEHGDRLFTMMGSQERTDLGTLKVAQINPGFTKKEINAAFTQVWDYDDQVRSSLPESELENYAAAMWSITHAPDNGTEATKDLDFKTASVAFGIFAPQIQSRLEQLQFKESTVTGIRSNECQNRSFNQERLPISVEFSPDTNQRVVKVEGKVLGTFEKKSPQLPTGTTAIASITTVLGFGVDAVTNDGQTIRVEVLKNYPYAQTSFQSQEASLTFQRIKNHANYSVVVAQLDGQILGEIKDVDSKNYLRHSGYLDSDKKPLSKNYIKHSEYIDSGKPLNVTITRDVPSVATIVVDPDTVIYPDVQTHDRALSTPGKKLDKIGQPYYLDCAEGRSYESGFNVSPEPPPELLPTLWSQSETGLTLAVDNRNTENLMGFFERFSVPITKVQDAPVETALGYAVVRFDSLPESVYSKLQDKFGVPLLTENYLAALHKGNRDAVPKVKPTDLTQLIPISSKESVEKNRVKDRAMAAIATQFIGFPAQSNLNVLSSTRDYQQTWSRYGLANTGNYIKDDVIMVSGSGPWRGVTNEQIQKVFETQYQPLLEQAIASRSQFVVGDAAGTDQLVQKYLEENGYELSQNQQGFLEARQAIIKQVAVEVRDQSRTNISMDILNKPTTNVTFQPSSQLVDIIEDVAYRENLTKEMESAFQDLSETDLGWLCEVTGLAIPIQRTGQEWESFSEDVFTAKFEDLLEATQSSGGMHTQQLAQLTILSHAANDLANSHPKLAESIESFYDQKVNFYENSDYSNPVKIERYLREEMNYENQFDFRLVNETLKTLGADFLIAQSSLQKIPITPNQALHEEKNGHTPKINPQTVQAQRSSTIAPIVMNLLNCKLASEYQGEKYTAIFDQNTQNISCYRSETKQLISQTQFRDGLWHPLPILLSEKSEPNLTQHDIEFFTQTLAPQLQKHQEQYQQVYLSQQSSFSDLEPTESDTVIALLMLKENHSIDQVCLTLNQSDTFKSLSPAEAIDYRQEIIDDALQLFEEQQERNQNNDEIELV